MRNAIPRMRVSGPVLLAHKIAATAGSWNGPRRMSVIKRQGHDTDMLELGDLEATGYRGAAAARPRCCRRRWTEFGELRNRRAELGSAESVTTNC